MRSCTTIVAAGMLAVCASAWGAAPAEAQSDSKTWPQRAVRLILPFGPASGADIAARLLSEKLQPQWKHPIVVEGKPGGDGLLSIGTVVNAKDDHVLFFGPSSAYVVHPYVHENLPYDPDRDLTPIAGVARVQIGIAVPASSGIENFKDFVAKARAEPGKLSYGVAPGFSEFVFNGFLKIEGLQLAKVPYRDITTSPTDLGEGRIQLAMLSYAALRPAEHGGRVKVLAIADDKRASNAAHIPSITEAGFPKLLANPILGMLGPRDMPIELRRRIGADIVEALKDGSVVERLIQSGQPPDPMGADAFAEEVKRQNDRVASIAQVLGMARKK